MASDLQLPAQPKAPAQPKVQASGNVDSVQILAEPTALGLVGGIINDVQCLIQQQLAMFRQELRNDVVRGKKAALVLGVGVGMSMAGVGFLLLMVPLLLQWALPALPLWACFGIVGGVVAVLGGVVVYAGVKTFESIDVLSSQAVESFKENLQWKMKSM
jgi:hypothetical protein